MSPFLDRLGVLHPADDGDRERLSSTLGIERFVHLSRQDKVGQAVSLVISAQTGLWHRNADGTIRQGGEPAEAPRYDRDQIAEAVRLLETEQRGWDRWFSEQSIAPLSLTYEALTTDPAETTAIVLEHLGVKPVAAPTVATAKLATSLNAAWVERFTAHEDSGQDEPPTGERVTAP